MLKLLKSHHMAPCNLSFWFSLIFRHPWGENLEPARQEKCEECLCEAEYDLSKMQPPLGDEVMKCCEPLKKDKGTKFLADPCEEIVTNLTKELEESTKECEKKNIVNAISAQPLLLQAFVKNLPKKYLSIPKSLEVTWLLSWTSYLQGILATVLFFSIGSLLVLKRFMGNRGSGVLEEHLLPVTWALWDPGIKQSCFNSMIPGTATKSQLRKLNKLSNLYRSLRYGFTTSIRSSLSR